MFFRLLDQTALKLEQEAYTCQSNPIPGHLLLLSAINPWMVGKPSWMGWNWSRLQVWPKPTCIGSQASTSDTFSCPSLTFQWLLWVSGLLPYTGADWSLESLLSSLSTRQVRAEAPGDQPSLCLDADPAVPSPAAPGRRGRRAEHSFLKEDLLVPDRARPLNSDRQETRHSRFNVLWFPPVKTGKLSACLEYLH